MTQENTHHIGNRRELFVDNTLIETRQDAQFMLHKPQPQEISLTCDAPWETKAPGYVTVLKVENGYRMYYRAMPTGTGRDEDKTQITCCAESNDGIHWTKPEYGLFEFQGSTRNNIVWRGTISHNFTPFYDTNPDCPRDQRYKAVGGTGKNFGLWPLVSPDGINWHLLTEDPLPLEGNFDSQNLVFWDEQCGLYRAFWRAGRGDDPKVPRGRDIRTATSPDFLTWSEAEWLDYDPNRSGSPEIDQDEYGDHHQLYTNCIMPYYRAPHLYLSFPMRYSDRGWTPSSEALPDLQKRRELADLNVKGGRPTRQGTVCCDTLFMASRDGQNFQVWPEAFVRPGIQRPGSWFYGQAACAWGFTETQSTYINGPSELSFYVQDDARVCDIFHLRRHTLRIDGFASIHAPLTGGTITTKPLQFTGNQLTINFSTSAGGRLRVALQDENGAAIPGFSLDDCDLQYGDQRDRVVSWQNYTDLKKLAGTPVRLCFELKDADVFSFQFVNEEQ